MLLAIDIGNTNITVGMFKDNELKATWRISTGVHRMPDEYAVILLNLLRHQGVDVADVTEGALSCVVPPLLTTFNELFQKYFNMQPLVVSPGIKTVRRRPHV
jgi:type III pantothenate kinase